MSLRSTILSLASTVVFTGSLNAEVHQANGIKIGEVTSTSAIIWTRLTQNSLASLNY